MPTESHADIGSRLRTAFNRLQVDRTALTRVQRRELARAAAQPIAAVVEPLISAGLVDLLAEDACWDVRLAATEALASLPAGDFARLARRLSEDSNSYVRRAAERVVGRRRREEAARRLERSGGERIDRQLRDIADEHGPVAAAKARRLCEHHTELLICSMVHDLRSILTHLSVNCLRALSEPGAGEAGRRAAQAARRVRGDLAFLEKTIQNMEQFTRAVVPRVRPVRLADVIDAAIALTRDNVGKENLDHGRVALEVTILGAIVVEAAEDLLVMALANVLKNAYEACLCRAPAHHAALVAAAGDNGGRVDRAEPGPPCAAVGAHDARLGGAATPDRWPSPRIVVQAAVAGEELRIVIRDNGMGLTDQELSGPILLIPGRRNKSKPHSTGYGLPIAERNLAAHGGGLRIESREDEGTTVTIRLPLTQHWSTP